MTCERCAKHGYKGACPIPMTQTIMYDIEWDCAFFRGEDEKEEEVEE